MSEKKKQIMSGDYLRILFSEGQQTWDRNALNYFCFVREYCQHLARQKKSTKLGCPLELVPLVVILYSSVSIK